MKDKRNWHSKCFIGCLCVQLLQKRNAILLKVDGCNLSNGRFAMDILGGGFHPLFLLIGGYGEGLATSFDEWDSIVAVDFCME